MADVNRGKRPLSPHLSIYHMAITMLVSILNRITGVGLAVPSIMVVAWLTAAATGPDSFALTSGLMTHWIAIVIWIGSIWALWFHFLGGLRHIWMDFGHGYDLRTVNATGWAVVIGSFILAILTVWLLLL